MSEREMNRRPGSSMSTTDLTHDDDDDDDDNDEKGNVCNIILY